jgi:hypothetical protein
MVRRVLDPPLRYLPWSSPLNPNANYDNSVAVLAPHRIRNNTYDREWKDLFKLDDDTASPVVPPRNGPIQVALIIDALQPN